eukprot:361014-Chlamydomonas_euryale.AAC.7
MNAQNAAAALGNAAQLAKVLVFGGAAVYGVSNSLFNVEGGHRAIVFNRLMGIKENVGQARRRAGMVHRKHSWCHHPYGLCMATYIVVFPTSSEYHRLFACLIPLKSKNCRHMRYPLRAIECRCTRRARTSCCPGSSARSSMMSARGQASSAAPRGARTFRWCGFRALRGCMQLAQVFALAKVPHDLRPLLTRHTLPTKTCIAPRAVGEHRAACPDTSRPQPTA